MRNKRKTRVQESTDQHKRHTKRLSKVSLRSIEPFLSEKTGIDFENGEGVIYKVYVEKKINPRYRSSHEPDLTIIYFANNQWRMAFIELKATRGLGTSEHIDKQRAGTLEEINNRTTFRNFLTSLGDERFTPNYNAHERFLDPKTDLYSGINIVDKERAKEVIAHQMFGSGIDYYVAKVTSNGTLVPPSSILDSEFMRN